MGYDERSRQLRWVAFSAVVLSTVAVTACLVTFPMVFHYVQTLQAEIENDVSFCKSRSRDLWKEMVDIENNDDDVDPSQLARAFATLKQADPAAQFRRITKRQSSVECCTCHRGQAGPAGAPGRDGRDGVPGAMGRPGENGPPASSPAPDQVGPPQCPCEAAGGPQGQEVPKDPPVGPAKMDLQATRAGQEPKDLAALRVRLVTPRGQVPRGPEATTATNQHRPDVRVVPANQADPEDPVTLASLVTPERADVPDHPAHLEPTATAATTLAMGNRAALAILVLMVPTVHVTTALQPVWPLAIS